MHQRFVSADGENGGAKVCLDSSSGCYQPFESEGTWWPRDSCLLLTHVAKSVGRDLVHGSADAKRG